MKHLTPQQEAEIVKAYTIDLVRMQELAEKHGRSRQGIWKVLRRNGVNPADYAYIKMKCLNCGKHFERRRCKVRNAGKLAHKKRNFCSVKCYYSYINREQGGEYKSSRQGNRIANKVVRDYILENNIPPPYGYIVHHVDRNCHNNDITNLMTFKDHSDHMKYHRGIWNVVPVFDGSKLK